MATGGDARRIPPCISTVCHPDREHRYVTCILCDYSYCSSDFGRKSKTGKGFFVTNSLVVCPNHNLKYDTAHTSNIKDINYDKRQVLKLKLCLIKKELETLYGKNDVNEDCDTLELQTIHELNTEVIHLKEMNIELVKQNEELRENSAFLRKSIITERSAVTPTYAATVSNNSNLTIKTKEHVPKIIITAKDSKNKAETYSRVTKQIQNLNSIKINNVFSSKKKDTVSVCCNKKIDVETVKNTLSLNLADQFSVEIQALKNPMLKIINIKNEMSKEELEEDINKRNFKDLQDTCKVVHNYKMKDSQCVIISLSADLYHYIRCNDYHIYVGHKRYTALDEFNLTLCGKCGRFGHNIKKCQNEEKCIKCAGDHSIYKCTSVSKQCHNCLFHNNKYKKSRPTDHMACEADKCDFVKDKINYITNNTDYPDSPITPTTIYYQKKLPTGK